MTLPSPGALLADWWAPGPWQSSSVNIHYAAAAPEHAGLPVLLVAVAGLLLAGLWHWRCRTRATYRAGFLTILAGCWLLLDLPWQWELASRLADTRARFADVPADDRPAHSEHGPFHHIAAMVRPVVEASPGRVFVTSLDEGRGMLTAYYLYPLNVYWERSAPALPAAASVQPGDYLLVLQPTTLAFDSRHRRLRGAGGPWPARAIARRSWGALYRAL